MKDDIRPFDWRCPVHGWHCTMKRACKERHTKHHDDSSGAGHYERQPIPNDDGVIRRFTVGRFVPAASRMMLDEEAPR